jgi:hypothetical protein
MAWTPPPPDRRCKAQSKQAKRQCAKWAEPGSDVCRFHGGGAKQVKAAAARRTAAAAAQAALNTYGLPKAVEPLDALLGELHRTAGHVAWLAQVVAALDQTDLGQRTMAGRVPGLWVQLYQEERKHLAKVATDCLRVGLDERRVKLAESQGALVADILRKVLTDLGVDPTSEQARTVVRRHLMAV